MKETRMVSLCFSTRKIEELRQTCLKYCILLLFLGFGLALPYIYYTFWDERSEEEQTFKVNYPSPL